METGEGYLLNTPAAEWEMTIPLGNGRLGACIWGNTGNERITINEESMWYGGARNRKNPYAPKCLDEIRRLILEGKVEEAEDLCQMAMTGNPKYVRPYQMACDMNFLFRHPSGRTEDYERVLDLRRAFACVTYRINDTVYTREYFVSMRYQVLAMRLRARGSHRLRFQCNINRRPFELHSGGNGTDAVYLRGRCGDGVEYYASAILAEHDGSGLQMGDYLAVRDATEAVIFFDFETDFAREDPETICADRLAAAKAAGYETVRQAHLKDYGELYGTMSLKLACGDYSRVPLDELKRRSDEEDVRRYLINQLFAFGRYLLIGSSYDCRLPANLQGIWCGSYTPRWESKYTININLEMNYWPVDSCGLSPCFAPFVRLLRKVMENGRSTAREIYGCRGSVAHHNTECGGDTDVEGLPPSAYMWPMGEAWLCLHLYDHYLYTLNEKFLRETALPIMRESILFFYDFLYRGEDGLWLTIPSVSPENTYRTKDGQTASVTMAPAMDNQILYELCSDYLEGSRRIGGGERDICVMAEEILKHLPSVGLTADGRIREWHEDYAETEKGHRHISHLFGLYPGRQIYEGEAGLMEAARKTLKVRLENGGGHTGWSRVWLICMFARLWDRKAVEENIRLFLKNSVKDNLFDSHPPFQIDGNFGFCAGVVESLAQKKGGKIYILPAVPEEWKAGEVRGLRLREGITADIIWDEKRVMCRLDSLKEQTVTVCCRSAAAELKLCPGQSEEYVYEIH